MQVFYESERDFSHRQIEIFATDGCAPHFHAQVEILCVMRGCISATVNGETQQMTSGGICVSGSYDVHAYTLEEDGEGIVMLLPLDYLQKFFGFTKNSTITRHFLCDDALFASVMTLLDLYRATAPAANELFFEGWCNTVLGILYAPLRFVAGEGGGKVDTIREVLTYIRNHYDEELTLGEVSKRFGYSPYHFSRLFNHYTNIGFKRYVNSVRLEVVAERLKNGESVLDAALNSGFNSMRSFYRSFTEYYGETPQRYARRYSSC